MNCEEICSTIIEDLANYVLNNKIKALVVGISGGIDSTVCAAICRTVCDMMNIPLIGRSLPIMNKADEFAVSELVGNAFCDDFKVCNLDEGLMYTNVLQNIEYFEGKIDSPIAKGNIQARLRMIYLYNLASIHNGIVIDTDNLTENNLGFFTIHGDQGDYKPIIGLWKTEVYELAEWIYAYCNNTHKSEMERAIAASIRLTPTDGLGISDSDLEQIGANSYADVDEILQCMACETSSENDTKQNELVYKYGKEVVSKVVTRHIKSQFKRIKTPGTYRNTLNINEN